MRRGALGLSLAASLVGCISAEVGVVTGTRRDCALAVIASDYESTSVSLLNADGSLCVDPLVHSGSGGVGLVTGLSGDVVFPSRAPADGRVWLIDRYPNAALSVVEPTTGEVVQTSVATGFPANPQDVWVAPEGAAHPLRWYVSRATTNPTPGKQAFDGGGDILMLDDGVPVGRIGLETMADAGYDPKPARLAGVGPAGVGIAGPPPTALIVGLAHLRRDFAGGGLGRVAVIDLAGSREPERLDVPDATNCVTVAPLPGGDRAVVVCSGVFAEPPRAAHSALVVVTVTGESRTIEHLWPAEPLVGAALGFGVAPLDSRRVVVLVFGDLGTGAKDRLAVVDVDTGTATDLGVGGDAFELGEPVWLPTVANGTLLVPEAHAAAPRLLPFHLGLDSLTLTASAPVNASPATGLPPRHVQFLGGATPLN